MNETAKRVRVTGRVQGVGFRAFTRDRATQLGLRGWVRNEPDNSVAAVVAGPEAAVARLLDELRRGPPGSVVEAITAAPAELPAQTRFEILR